MLYKQEAMVEGLADILKGRNHLLVVELPMSLDVQCLVVDMQGVNVEWHSGHGRELELEQSSMEVYLQMLDKLEAGKQHYQHGLYPTNSQQAALHHLRP